MEAAGKVGERKASSVGELQGFSGRERSEKAFVEAKALGAVAKTKLHTTGGPRRRLPWHRLGRVGGLWLGGFNIC